MFSAMDATPRIGVKVCMDGPMSALETRMDWCSRERFLTRLIRAEERNWGSALNTVLPEVDYEEIMDDTTRQEVLKYFNH